MLLRKLHPRRAAERREVLRRARAEVSVCAGVRDVRRLLVVQLLRGVRARLLQNCHPVDGKLELGDLTPLQCRYDFGHQTLVGTAEGSTVSFKFDTFSI